MSPNIILSIFYRMRQGSKTTTTNKMINIISLFKFIKSFVMNILYAIKDTFLILTISNAVRAEHNRVARPQRQRHLVVSAGFHGEPQREAPNLYGLDSVATQEKRIRQPGV